LDPDFSASDIGLGPFGLGDGCGCGCGDGDGIGDGCGLGIGDGCGLGLTVFGLSNSRVPGSAAGAHLAPSLRAVTRCAVVGADFVCRFFDGSCRK